MSANEPPDGTTSDVSGTEPAGRPGETSGPAPAQPTVPLNRETPPGEPSSGAAHSAETATATGSAEPTAAAAPATTSVATVRGPRRRWTWIAGGVAVVIVSMLIGAAAALGIVHHRIHERFAAGGGPAAAARAWGHGGHPGGHHLGGQFGGRLGGPGGGHGGMAGAHRGGPGQPGTSTVFGAVSTVNGANLVLTPDAATAPVTVTTTDRTRVLGGQARSLADLKAGDRVAVRVAPDHSASAVVFVPARLRGTVTVLSGTAATVVQPDGLSQAVDTSALPTQPQVGDRVLVVGSVNGSTIKATNLRELPKTG